MKIVVIGPVYPYRGGIAHYTSQLSNSLIANGHETKIFSFRRQYPGWLYPGKSDKEPGQSGLRMAAEFTLDPFYPWTWVNTAKAIVGLNPDAVLIQWWTTFWSPAFWGLSRLLVRYGIRVIFVIHNVAPHEPLPWDNWLAGNVLKQGEAYIVQSVNEQARLESLLPGAISILCPHPVYNQFVVEPEISRSEAKNRLGLNNDNPLILFFGIIRPYKGLKFTIQAISNLNAKGITAHLIVAGEFWEKINEFEDQIIDLNLSDQITLINRYIPNEEVGLFFTAADIFIAPYIGGTQSGSVKIALSFNLPIVVTDRVADDILLRSKMVRIVPSEDSEALAAAIGEFIMGGNPDPAANTKEHRSWNQLITAIENLVVQGKENTRGA